jgi:hypothetical protein
MATCIEFPDSTYISDVAKWVRSHFNCEEYTWNDIADLKLKLNKLLDNISEEFRRCKIITVDDQTHYRKFIRLRDKCQRVDFRKNIINVIADSRLD